MAIGTEFTISGNATTTLGYDMDDEKLGFKNEAEANISLVFAPGKMMDGDEMMEKEEMSGWVGSLELSDFRISIDSDHKHGKDDAQDPQYVEQSLGRYYICFEHDADGMCTKGASYDKEERSRTGLLVREPKIVAKLQNGPLWIQIFSGRDTDTGGPANDAGMIGPVENDSDKPSKNIEALHDKWQATCKVDPMTNVRSCDNKLYDDMHKAIRDNEDLPKKGDNAAESNDGDNDVHTDGGGQGITLGYTTGDLDFQVGVSSDQPFDNDKDGGFMVSAVLGVNVGPAELDLQVVQGIQVEEVGSDDTGLSGKLTTTFGDVSLNAGADVVVTQDPDLEATEFNEAMLWETGGGAEVLLTPNTKISTNFIYSSKMNVGSDVEVVLDDKSGLVEGLDLALTWGMFDLANGDPNGAPTENNESDMFLSGEIIYALEAMGGTFKPGTKVTLNQVDGEDAVVGLEVRGILTDAIPHTEFGLKWKTGRLADAGGMDAEQGTVSLWTKISY
jgi:hypothetical protein